MKDTKARDTKDRKNTSHKGHKTQVRVLNITALKTRNRNLSRKYMLCSFLSECSSKRLIIFNERLIK